MYARALQFGSRRKDFDADVYEQILRTHEPDFVFVSGGNSQQIEQTGSQIHGILEHVLPRTKVIALADRDDKSPKEASQYRGIVLTKRNIESYLLADDVIKALVDKKGKSELYNEALQIKSKALQDSIERGNRCDDLKSAAGEIYVGLKKLLDLQQPGDNKDTFMRDTLAPLISPEMKTYQELKSHIIDKIRNP